jgi:hypothetical protein
MSLWSNTDAAGSVPKYFVSGDDGSGAQMIFVSQEEAQLAENRERGLDSPGWYRYFTFTDQHGNTRHKAELQVAMMIPQATAGDQADDAIAADVSNVITISAQPAAASVTAPATATFTVTASVTTGTGTIAYQWQRKAEGGRWNNISGATSASYTTPATTVADNNGDMYRVKLTTDTGAREVTSDAATLTVA